MLDEVAVLEDVSVSQFARPHVPWYLRPLILFVHFVVLVVVMIPLGILALLSIPYFILCPDRQIIVGDLRGTDRQRELLAKWKSVYRSLGFFGRIKRSMKLARRRWRSKYLR